MERECLSVSEIERLQLWIDILKVLKNRISENQHKIRWVEYQIEEMIPE